MASTQSWPHSPGGPGNRRPIVGGRARPVAGVGRADSRRQRQLWRVYRTSGVSPGTTTAASECGCRTACPPLCGAQAKVGRATGWAGRAQCLFLLPQSRVTRKAVGDQDRVVPPSGPRRLLQTITASLIQFRRLSRPQCPRQPRFRSPCPQFRSPLNCFPSGPPLTWRLPPSGTLLPLLRVNSSFRSQLNHHLLTELPTHCIRTPALPSTQHSCD